MVQLQTTHSQEIFSPEQIRNLSGLGSILRQIRTRLILEGVSIDDARQELLNEYEKNNQK